MGIKPLLALHSAPDLDPVLDKPLYHKGGFIILAANLTVSNLIPEEDYINCVISREMSGTWPLEALKAQAVCARNYYKINLGKHKKHSFDICATTDCQVYYGMSQTNNRTTQAASETAGIWVCYQGKLASTFYCASDGGGTEDVRNVWGARPTPIFAE